jgi:hypothetical protein
MVAGYNLGLITTRSVEIARGFEHVFCSKLITQHHTVSSKEVDFLFPLYLYPSQDALSLHQRDREANISDAFVKALTRALPLSWIRDGAGDLQRTVGPEDVFSYIYAVLHSPTYRERYGDFLRHDFPRIPLTSSLSRFRTLVDLGRELTSIHLLESPAVAVPITNYPVPGPNVVESPYPRFAFPSTPPADSSSSSTGRVYISRAQYFQGVPPEVWDFHIGGYRVCDRWLRDRQRTRLTLDDLACYERVVVAIRDTIVLMTKVDAAIPSWPLS